VSGNLFSSFLEGNLDTIRLFQASFDQMSGVPLAPKDIQRVYKLNWDVFCAFIRSDIVTILACLDLSPVWILVTYLLDHAGILPQQRTVIIVTNAPVYERIEGWNVLKGNIKKLSVLLKKLQSYLYYVTILSV
jgi:hypothetical protein